MSLAGDATESVPGESEGCQWSYTGDDHHLSSGSDTDTDHLHRYSELQGGHQNHTFQ